MQKLTRLKRELELLSTEPPVGVTCWQHKNQMDDLRAQILGCVNTPYEGGVFNLEILITERYPFEPPKIRFLTPIYHPNIDSAGRICLDILKLPPKGAWKPSLNIFTVLTSLQLLMAEPNPDDPLMADISSEFKYNKPAFLENAKKWTQKYAIQKKQDCGDVDSGHCGPRQEEAGSSKDTAATRKRTSSIDPENPKKTCL
ncbi:ubiquitin-conjugating enzyme E2 T [Latimeria chalumnae]|uniref:Ubiquitin-conjugating enzyme E2 T n=1 Tax=Latimeria chalumnae TaxID=7897 RepID=H3B6P3_LATCH|nr:PREDICTED: ubiquitin-conjugating enzyme E2 T [Latimeria chalumnae]|eukprot:XP_005995507.1 PREDICTED: ubiquitin-conjugating enzyme E2 T [Latimeria chalumnae]